MVDSYSTIAAVARDLALGDRVTACLAQLGHDDPEALAYAMRWRLAAQPGWAAAWDSAAASSPPMVGRGDFGGDEDVITDGMILAAVQAVLGA